MSDWHGTTGRDDLVGGGDGTQYSTTIEGITLCSTKPFTDDEKHALAEYFRLLHEKRGVDAEVERRRGLIVLRDEDGEIADTYMADCACNHAWETHPDTGCSGLDSYGCECECPGYEPNDICDEDDQ
ncbi:hypothetical protein ACX9NE_26855 [Mycobacterium sp. ML4]